MKTKAFQAAALVALITALAGGVIWVLNYQQDVAAADQFRSNIRNFLSTLRNEPAATSTQSRAARLGIRIVPVNGTTNLIFKTQNARACIVTLTDLQQEFDALIVNGVVVRFQVDLAQACDLDVAPRVVGRLKPTVKPASVASVP